MQKKVSLIIPVYNGSNYLKYAIDSALSQTYKNIEVIVVNDGSNDGGKTKEIAESYGNDIIYLEKENGGVSTALNLAISKSSGEYISWLSHDDMYYPNKIEREIEEILKHDENTIIFSNFDYINEYGEKLKEVYLDHELVEKNNDYAVLRGMIGGITLLIPKKAFEEYGEFDPRLRCTQDYDMWFKMLKTYKFVHIEDILAMTRIHSLQDTNTSPRVLSEGNKLWIDIVNNYSLQKKIAMSGSEYIFYKEMANYLGTTPYEEAQKNAEQLAEETLSKVKRKNFSVSAIIISNNDDNNIKKTLLSLKNQNYKNLKVLVEGNYSDKNIVSTKNRQETLKKIDTDYYVFFNAGVEIKPNWLDKKMLIVKTTDQAVTITNYDRPNKNELINNYTTFICSIDGIIYSSKYKSEYENDYLYTYEIAKRGGSITLEDNDIINKKTTYNMKEVYTLLTKLLKDKVLTDYQTATLCYEIACVYNKSDKKSKTVNMYEPCDTLRTLMFSRSFRLLKKYIDYRHVKEKTKQNKKIKTSAN